MLPDNGQPSDPFHWHAHPFLEGAWRAVAAIVIVAALAVVVYVVFGDRLLAVVSLVLLVVSLNRFFFPSRFLIDAEGITARYPLRTQRLLWRNLRRFVHDRSGGYLSTRARAGRMDAYRGMHVLFGPKPEAIIERISSAMSQRERSCAG